MKKTGKAASFIAGTFLMIPEGHRVPTISDLSKRSGFSRGTIQNALHQLESVGAMVLESHGHLGTLLKKRDVTKLVQATGKQYVSGIMPMPYTPAYEGLATGLFNSITAREGVSADIAYMRGSRKRISALMEGKYDFAVVSHYAVRRAREEGADVEIALDLGPNSYLAGHELVFRDRDRTALAAGMRVGVDYTSYDHEGLTRMVAADTEVEFVSVNYGQILSLLRDNFIDAALCNKDQMVNEPDMAHRPAGIDAGTVMQEVSAVLAVRGDNLVSRALVAEFVDAELVKRQQREVINGERYPNY